MFDQPAEEFIALCGGDEKVALKKALAFLSGTHNEEMV
jgi:hypothetical protein